MPRPVEGHVPFFNRPGPKTAFFPAGGVRLPAPPSNMGISGRRAILFWWQDMAQETGAIELDGNGRMRTLVVYFSRSGTTDKVAGEIARALGADIERITDHEDRSGFAGYMRSGRQALKEVPVAIDEPRHDPAGYGLVVVGTPVWAYKMCSPVRTYLANYASRIKDAAFFCTADRREERTLEDMAQLAGKRPRATLVVYKKAVLKNGHLEKVREFVSALRTCPADRQAGARPGTTKPSGAGAVASALQ
jgi:flavodoxin